MSYPSRSTHQMLVLKTTFVSVDAASLGSTTDFLKIFKNSSMVEWSQKNPIEKFISYPKKRENIVISIGQCFA